jgi:hypothetical protein
LSASTPELISILGDIEFLCISLLMSWSEPNIETARNNSCVITIVGYHGNSVYQVVALIPDWVTVTSAAV